MSKAIFSFLIILSAYSAFAQSTQPGLDLTFGEEGIVIDTTKYFDQVCDLAIQPDGKIIAAGADYIARYLSNGNPDSSFARIGHIPVTVLTDSLGGYGANVFLLADGKIIMSGRTTPGAYVLKLKADGKFDSSFGTNGKTLFCCGALRAALQADGKILTTGIEDYDYAAIHCFTPNGKVDSSFGKNGSLRRYIGTGINIAGIGILSDGRIGITGDNGSSAWYARYLPDGKPDSSLSGTGIIYPMGAIYCHTAIIYDDGKLLVSKGGLNFSSDAEIVRLKANGTVDSTFGNNGLLNVPGLRIVSLLQLSDGKILCGGFNDEDFAIARLNKDGASIDRSFGRNGIITSDIAGWNRDRGYVLAMQPDGKILLAGESQKEMINVWYPPRATIVRYLPDAPVGIKTPTATSPNAIRIYPNPAHTTLEVSGPPSLAGKSVQVLSIEGKVLRQVKGDAATVDIDVSTLPAGTYVIKVQAAASTMQARLFVKE